MNSLSKNGSPTGADNFLPVLIFSVLQAKPSNPYSNIEYIGNFRSPRRIAGPEEYFIKYRYIFLGITLQPMNRH